VTVSTGPEPIAPRFNAPRDLDGDGPFENVNGDGRFNVIDVSIFLGAFDRSGVRDRMQLFEFKSDGRINVIDVSDPLART